MTGILDQLPDTESATRSFGMRQKIGFVIGVAAALAVVITEPPDGLSLSAWRTVAVALLMAAWWISEAIPIFATSLLPLILLPLLGISTIDDAAGPYANPLIFLFMGGFMIALAMERWDLHRRIALTIVNSIGTQPRRIVAGFMVAAAFLSMWVSNTATAMMILPIGISVIGLVRQSGANAGRNFGIGLMLGIAYACSIGGISTLIGTPTNALLAGFMLEHFEVDIAFVDWFVMALPLTIVGLIIIFFVLTRLVYPIRLVQLKGSRELIAEQLANLGPMTRAEKLVATVFAIVGALWMSRPVLDDWIVGLSDPVIAMGGAIVLFILPVDLRQGIFVLNWEWARRIPWGVLILFGGGLSLASAIQTTGLADWLGTAVAGLAGWPVLWIMLAVVTVIIGLTELTSNTATAAAFLPVLSSVAIGIGQNPLLLMIPATVAASCAFMLPVATPPNAIVYGSGAITIPQMARAGIVLNLSFAIVITVYVYLALPMLFDIEIGTLPGWATQAP